MYILDGEFTRHRFVIADVVTRVAFVGRLLDGQFHVPVVVLLHGVQYPVGPGRSSLHIVVIGAEFKFERGWELR